MALPQDSSPAQINLQIGNTETSGGSQSFTGYAAGPVHLHTNQDSLDALPRAAGAAFNSSELEHERLCLPGTRTKILQLIEQWVANPQGERILWLSGMAGTGKSTIARTLSRTSSEKNQLGASFFFSRGRGDRGNATKFFTSLAYQIASWDIENGPLVSLIRKAVKLNPDIAKRAKRDQWKHLIEEPLSQMKNQPSPRTILLVVDALDECENDRDVQLILKILFEAKQNIHLRIFLTSRPSISVHDGFRGGTQGAYQSFVLHEIEKNIIQQDLRIFFEYELNDIRKIRRLTSDFASESDLEALVQRAGKLFIYATTVCLFLRERKRPPPRDRLNIILQNHASTVPALKHIDQLYIQILQEAVREIGLTAEDKAEFSAEFMTIVGSIVNLFSALSVGSLAALLSKDVGDIELILESLRSVLDVPESSDGTITLLHPSFRDFLLDQTRCTDSAFWIDTTETQIALTENCLNLMTVSLKRDICGLKLPGILIEEIDPRKIQEHIPAELDYACTYWVRHLESSFQAASITIRHDLLDRVQYFLEHKVLYWFESLSLLGKMQDVVIMLPKLLNLAKSCHHERLVELVYDAYRFSLEYRFIIEQAPLQTYHSALIFSPSISIIRKLFKSQVPSWVNYPPKVPGGWGPLLQTLEGHESAVQSVAFSPDGQKLASGSNDNNIRVWDAASGSPLQTLVGHTDWVVSVAFSPDGKQLASGSHDKTVRIWDAAFGSLLRILVGHTGLVYSVSFLLDGQQLASGSSDKTVRIWNTVSGKRVSGVVGFPFFESMAFSPDGQRIAIPSHSVELIIWDRASHSICQTLKGHTGKVNPLVFSPDGQKLASGSFDQTVRVWDIVSGSLLQMLEGHTGEVVSLAFSLDGQKLASGSTSQTILVWDVSSGSLINTLECYAGLIYSIVFSPDGQRLASGSLSTGGVFIWDVAYGSLLPVREGHIMEIESMEFSPDGLKIASGSDDGQICVWEATSGSLLHKLENSDNPVDSIAFSPDGQRLASGAHVWDVAFGSLLRPLEGGTTSTSSVAFSPDGQKLVAQSDNNELCIWGAASRLVLQKLKRNTDWIRTVAFSPNGQELASGSRDITVRVWNAVSGRLLRTLDGHTNGINSVAYSLTGQKLASGSDDKKVCVWDAASGSLLQTLEGHTDEISLVKFSLDGRRLASTSGDNTVRVWDPASGSLLQKLECHPCWVPSFAMSNPSQLEALRVVGRWVTMNQKRLIWLPSARQVVRAVSYQTKLAIGSDSGIVTILNVDSKKMDPVLL